MINAKKPIAKSKTATVKVRQTVLRDLFRRSKRLSEFDRFFSDNDATAVVDLCLNQTLPWMTIKVSLDEKGKLAAHIVPGLRITDPDLQTLLGVIDLALEDPIDLDLLENDLYILSSSTDSITVRGLEAVMTSLLVVGSDVMRFLTFVLQTPSLRCDPRAAFRAFGKFISNTERNFQNITDELEQEQAETSSPLVVN